MTPSELLNDVAEQATLIRDRRPPLSYEQVEVDLQRLANLVGLLAQFLKPLCKNGSITIIEKPRQ